MLHRTLGAKFMSLPVESDSRLQTHHLFGTAVSTVHRLVVDPMVDMQLSKN